MTIDLRPSPLPLGHLAILRDRDSFVGREYQVIDVYEFQNENFDELVQSQ